MNDGTYGGRQAEEARPQRTKRMNETKGGDKDTTRPKDRKVIPDPIDDREFQE